MPLDVGGTDVAMSNLYGWLVAAACEPAVLEAQARLEMAQPARFGKVGRIALEDGESAAGRTMTYNGRRLTALGELGRTPR